MANALAYLSMLLLLRHDIAEEWFNSPAYAVYIIGIAFFVITAVLQVLLDKNKIGTPPEEQPPSAAWPRGNVVYLRQYL